MSAMDIKVPDIGDFKDVPVIEILVKPGDAVKKEDPLVTLESEKAAMEVPSPGAGIVKHVSVKVGDKVSQGSVILTLEQQDAPASTVDDERPEDNVDESAEVMEAPGAPPAAPPPPQPEAQAQPRGEAGVVELRVPNIGDFKDIPVIEVLIEPGQEIKKDASMITLESEKAAMEVPAGEGGTIKSVTVKVGDRVSQGSVIGTILRQPGAAISSAPAPQQPAPQQPAPVVAPQRAATPAPEPVDAQPAANGTVHASPSIRRFARELGVDLHTVRGSGPSGRITREDVQNFVKTALKTGTPSAAGSGAGLGLAPWPKVDFAQFGEIDIQPLSRIQKLSGPNLHRNWVMIPHVTNNDDADITDLEAFRKQLNAENAKSGTKVTILAFLIKAAVAALKQFPQFNASLDGDQLVFKKYYNIGFAADTPGGLIVPVIKDADKKGILDIARETSELAAKGRDGKLGLQDMQGGTFTISSLGGIGGTYFTPIINAPDVAILGVCKSALRPVWNGEQFVPRLMLPLSLSYDHRVIDGAAAARFNVFLAGLLADMRRAML